MRATKEEANAVLSSIGNEVTDAEDNTFFWMFDEPLPQDADYLLTVEVDGKNFGITSPSKSRKSTPNCIKLYFQLNNGKQTDFVDGQKASEDTGKFDFSTYTGVAISSLYLTDPQSDGVYPTGLKLLRQKSIYFDNAE